MAQNPHEYLIEQLQHTGAESVGSSSNKIRLNFNHPCKELVWVVQPDCNADYCSATRGGTTLYKALGAQPFNYTDAVDLSLTPSRLSADTSTTENSSPLANSKPLLLPYKSLVTAPENGLVSVTPTTPVYRMLVLSYLLNLPSTCTAGVKTLSSPLSSNLTAKTDSRNVKVPTSTKSNLGNTTPELLIPVSTSTPSPLDLKNTNHREPATCPESTTLPFNLFSNATLKVPTLRRCAFTPIMRAPHHVGHQASL